ncbi:MAG: hypothetical protein HY650_07145 [Acidobacteria bacterium]|nr:hypothetical protein [Acidobacteriota bacterium]
MLDHSAKLKVASILLVLTFFIISPPASAGEQARSKKEIMTEMGRVYLSMDQKMVSGINSARFTDADYAELVSQCELLTRLATDYGKAEGKPELAEIAKSLGSTTDYLKQQVERKDPVVMASTFGRVLSFCAECHYTTRE